MELTLFVTTALMMGLLRAVPTYSEVFVLDDVKLIKRNIFSEAELDAIVNSKNHVPAIEKDNIKGRQLELTDKKLKTQAAPDDKDSIALEQPLQRRGNYLACRAQRGRQANQIPRQGAQSSATRISEVEQQVPSGQSLPTNSQTEQQSTARSSAESKQRSPNRSPRDRSRLRERPLGNPGRVDYPPRRARSAERVPPNKKYSPHQRSGSEEPRLKEQSSRASITVKSPPGALAYVPWFRPYVGRRHRQDTRESSIETHVTKGDQTSRVHAITHSPPHLGEEDLSDRGSMHAAGSATGDVVFARMHRVSPTSTGIVHTVEGEKRTTMVRDGVEIDPRNGWTAKVETHMTGRPVSIHADLIGSGELKMSARPKFLEHGHVTNHTLGVFY